MLSRTTRDCMLPWSPWNTGFSGRLVFLFLELTLYKLISVPISFTKQAAFNGSIQIEAWYVQIKAGLTYQFDMLFFQMMCDGTSTQAHQLYTWGTWLKNNPASGLVSHQLHFFKEKPWKRVLWLIWLSNLSLENNGSFTVFQLARMLDDHKQPIYYVLWTQYRRCQT